MPNWRDSLKGHRSGSIPPPTPEPSGGALDLSAYEGQNIRLTATADDSEVDSVLIEATNDNGTVSIKAGDGLTWLNLDSAVGMLRAVADNGTAALEATGDDATVHISAPGTGGAVNIDLRSPDGATYRLAVANGGALTAELV